MLRLIACFASKLLMGGTKHSSPKDVAACIANQPGSDVCVETSHISLSLFNLIRATHQFLSFSDVYIQPV